MVSVFDGVAGALVATVALAGILLFILGGSRLRGKAGRTPGLAGIGRPAKAEGFTGAFVAATALSSTLNLIQADPWATGATLAVIWAVLSIPGLGKFRTLLNSIAGILGIIATMALTIRDRKVCPPQDALSVWFTILLLAVVLLAALAGWLVGHVPTSPLVIFSAFTVIRFFASPLGVPVFQSDHPAAGATIALVAAMVLGFLGGRWPAAIVGLASIGIALTVIAISAFTVPLCGAILEPAQAYFLLAFSAVSVVCRVLFTVFTKHR